MEVPVRERGTQSRRANPSDVGPTTDPDIGPKVDPKPGPPRTPRYSNPPGGGSSGGRGAGIWPVVAVIAIIVATAGWTTVAVMALNGTSGAPVAAAVTPDPAIEDPNATADDTATDPSDEPLVESHDVPELEALLPSAIDGTPMNIQSWTGDSLLSDDSAWSDAVTSYLKSVGKTQADLAAAQAFDESASTDHGAYVFRLEGVPPASLRDGIIAASKGDFPDVKVSTIKLGGTDVTKADFGDGAINSYYFIKDGLVFDVETPDQAIATTLVKGLQDGTIATGPTSSGSAAPDGSPAASPSPS
jgi:hypothetical protein